MIIYFAGNGRRAEDVHELLNRNTDDWGVLLSYKYMQVKTIDGSTLFNKIKKRILNKIHQ